MYSERFENRATVKAGELVKAGAIGQVIQTIGLGPHRITPATPAGVVLATRRSSAASSATSPRTRPISSCTSPDRRSAEVVSSQVGNVHHPDQPKFEDFGDVMLRGDRGAGYIRVDWFTPDGLVDLGRRPAHDPRAPTASSRSARTSTSADARAASHLFLVDKKETRYIDCQGCRAAVRRAARDRRPQPHRDGDAAGALLPGDRADAEGAGAGADASRIDGVEAARRLRASRSERCGPAASAERAERRWHAQ